MPIFLVVSIGILILVLTSGCSTTNDTSSLNHNPAQEPASLPTMFQVRYYDKCISSSGGKELNITYTVDDGIITACSGTYKHPAPVERRGETDTEPCDVNKILSTDLMFRYPFNVPTDFSMNNLSGEETYFCQGFGNRSWEVLI